MENTQSVLSRSDYLKLDVQQRLEFWIALPHGSMLPDDWGDAGRWDDLVREVCIEALKEIKFLRRYAGAVSRGPSFADLKAQAQQGSLK